MKFITKMQSTKLIFENFVGLWSIKRVLGNYGTAEGVAKFALQNEHGTIKNSLGNETQNSSDEKTFAIDYREDLQVKCNTDFGPNVENSAYKEYVYEYDMNRDKIVKKFTNGNLFYELSIDFDKQTAHGDHLCEKDMYKAIYTFSDPQTFTLTYYVNGPKKDYLIETEFRKLVTDS